MPRKTKESSDARGRLLALAFFPVVVAAAATPVSAGHPLSIQRLGRLVGAGWGDGYHACRDGGCRPGADLPPGNYYDQFGRPKKTCPTCGPVYPPGTTLANAADQICVVCDSGDDFNDFQVSAPEAPPVEISGTAPVAPSYAIPRRPTPIAPPRRVEPRRETSPNGAISPDDRSLNPPASQSNPDDARQLAPDQWNLEPDAPDAPEAPSPSDRLPDRDDDPDLPKTNPFPSRDDSQSDRGRETGDRLNDEPYESLPPPRNTPDRRQQLPAPDAQPDSTQPLDAVIFRHPLLPPRSIAMDQPRVYSNPFFRAATPRIATRPDDQVDSWRVIRQPQ